MARTVSMVANASPRGRICPGAAGRHDGAVIPGPDGSVNRRADTRNIRGDDILPAAPPHTLCRQNFDKNCAYSNKWQLGKPGKAFTDYVKACFEAVDFISKSLCYTQREQTQAFQCSHTEV